MIIYREYSKHLQKIRPKSETIIPMIRHEVKYQSMGEFLSGSTKKKVKVDEPRFLFYNSSMKIVDGLIVLPCSRVPNEEDEKIINEMEEEIRRTREKMKKFINRKAKHWRIATLQDVEQIAKPSEYYYKHKAKVLSQMEGKDKTIKRLDEE